MQIDPSALSRQDSTTTTTTTGAALSMTTPSTAKATATTTTTTPTPLKIPKTVTVAQRVDFEPIYTELKAAIGAEHWSTYKEAVTLFLIGQLNQNEFCTRVDSFLTTNNPATDSKIERLHNRFICAIIGNLSRELPDHGVAAWVSANDKPTLVSKPVSGDAAEQRLKTEVMQLPPRDRRRLKAITEPDSREAASHNPLEEYHSAKQIRVPDQVPASAGGLNKTNWELEIRKRYAQPLASEIGEFPDTDSIQARMIPICYEESVPSGASQPCAEYMAIATEIFVKEFLANVFVQTRSNAPTSMGIVNNVMTRRYRRQLDQESMALARGEISRNHTNGMLPIEAKEAVGRNPIGMQDIRLAVQVGGSGILGHWPITRGEVIGGWRETEEWDSRDGDARDTDLVDSTITTTATAEMRPVGEDGHGDDDIDAAVVVGGSNSVAAGADMMMSMMMDVDEADWTSAWEGGARADRDLLGSVLDDCLAIGS